MVKKLLLSTLLLTGVINAESSIGLDINSEDVELLGAIDLNSAIGYTGGTSYLVAASYLHNEDDDLFTIGLSGENSLEAAPGLIFGFGFKAAFAEDFMAIPLLGKVKYILPFDSDIPTTSFLASFAYAPSVLTFSDGDTYSELRLEADMEVISNIHVFTGYRNIYTDYETYEYQLNDSFYGGLKLSF
jgi:hypothetical protein